MRSVGDETFGRQWLPTPFPAARWDSERGSGRLAALIRSPVLIVALLLWSRRFASGPRRRHQVLPQRGADLDRRDLSVPGTVTTQTAPYWRPHGAPRTRLFAGPSARGRHQVTSFWAPSRRAVPLLSSRRDSRRGQPLGDQAKTGQVTPCNRAESQLAETCRNRGWTSIGRF